MSSIQDSAVVVGPPVILPPSIAVNAPSAGSYPGGTTVQVEWLTVGGVSGFNVLLSTNGGASFQNVSGAELPGTAASFSLLLPSPTAAEQAEVQVVGLDSAGNTAATGLSPVFTITPPAAVVSASFSPGTSPQTPLVLVAGGSVSLSGEYVRTANGVDVADKVEGTLSTLPSGVTYTFSADPVETFTNVTITLFAGQQVQPEKTSFSVDGESTEDELAYAPEPFNLVVQNPNYPTITLVATPASQIIHAGAATSYDVTDTANAAAAGLAVSNLAVRAGDLPPGATATFTSTSLPAPGSTSTLTVNTTYGTPPGDYKLHVTGTPSAKATLNAAMVDLMVKPPLPRVLLKPMGTTFGQVDPGTDAIYYIQVTSVNYTGSVDLVVTSQLPEGVTHAFEPPSPAAGTTSKLTLSSKALSSTGGMPLAVEVAGTAGSGSVPVTGTSVEYSIIPPSITLTSKQPDGVEVEMGEDAVCTFKVEFTGLDAHDPMDQITFSYAFNPPSDNDPEEDHTPSNGLPGAVVFTFTTTNTPTGNYVLEVTGTRVLDETVSGTASVLITVNARGSD